MRRSHMDRRISINENDTHDLEKLREMARVASIYHGNRTKFRRNKNLSHLVHASLHFLQFFVGLAIEIFHHVHHYVNRNRREGDESIPQLPEEMNPIFIVYPLCMAKSLVFAKIWLFTNIFMRKPIIVFIGCFIAATLMLIVGIVEMKHVDLYVDLTAVSDDELLTHPIFLHNFIMCLLSSVCMSMYLIQGWILFDYYHWVKSQTGISDMQISDFGAETDTIEEPETREEDKKHKREEKEAPGELDPIPALETFPSITIPETLVSRS